MSGFPALDRDGGDVARPARGGVAVPSPSRRERSRARYRLVARESLNAYESSCFQLTTHLACGIDGGCIKNLEILAGCAGLPLRASMDRRMNGGVVKVESFS